MFKKYNFIVGTSSSGKTSVMIKISELFKNSLYLDADNNNIHSQNRIRISTFNETINVINSFVTDPHFIFIDGINNLTASKYLNSNKSDLYKAFFNELPKKHTYFISNNLNSIDIAPKETFFRNLLVSYSISLNLPKDDIFVLECRKQNRNLGNISPIEIINHQLVESYNIGNLDSIIRDYKINLLI